MERCTVVSRILLISWGFEPSWSALTVGLTSFCRWQVEWVLQLLAGIRQEDLSNKACQRSCYTSDK